MDLVSIISNILLLQHMVFIIRLIFVLGQENGVSYSNVGKHNGELYDLRINYQSKVTEVFQEPSK